MVGININCKLQDFIDLMFKGKKIEETRNTHSLRPYVGKRVGIIRTGCGKAMLVGYMTITYEYHYKNKTEFRKNFAKHRVIKDGKYDYKTDKWGYGISDVVMINPIPVTTVV